MESMFRVSIVTLTLLAAAFMTLAVPSVSADPICVDDPRVPDYLEPCLNDPEACLSVGLCVGDSPREIVEWVKEQLGPCICDPQPTPW